MGTLLIVLGATIDRRVRFAFAAFGDLAAVLVALLVGISVMFWGSCGIHARGDPGGRDRHGPSLIARSTRIATPRDANLG